jgi:hypothetical protein
MTYLYNKIYKNEKFFKGLSTKLDETNDSKLLKNEKNVHQDFVYKEGGFGWVVVIATGYCFGVLIGMINNYALILNELDRVYNDTENHVLYSGLENYYT